MAYKKGESGNPKGKPKGTISEKTEFWNQVKEWFINDGAAKYMQEMEMLKGQAYIMAYNNGLEYFKPKLARTVDKEGEDIIPATLTIEVVHSGPKISESEKEVDV